MSDHEENPQLEEFEQYYDQYAPQLLSWLTSKTKNKQAVEDVSQEVWLRVSANLERFNGNNFPAWLFTIANNCLIDHWRKENRYTGGELMDIPEESVSQLDRLVQEEKVAVLKECLELLSDKLRVVVERRMALEPSNVIGEQLGIPVGAVYQRYHRAGLQLRDCVERKL